MNLGELCAATRTMLDDLVEPYLWPTADIQRRLNNAVREACLRARLLRVNADTNPKRCMVSVAAGSKLIHFDPTILVVRGATVASAAQPLRLASTDDMDAMEPGWDAGRACSGNPRVAVMDIAQKTLQLWPTPAANITLRLRVWCVPAKHEQMHVRDDEPAVALPDAEELCHWAAHECYMVRDAETFDPQAAAEHLQVFTARFGERPSLHEMARWADTPPRVRLAHMF